MIKGRRIYNLDQVLNSVSHEDLFRKYCPNFNQVGAFFKSEFRIDSKPSCVINPTPTGLKYKDFGENEGSLNILDYLQKKFNISLQDALDIVANDSIEFSKSKTYQYNLKERIKSERVDKTPTILDIKARDFSKYDLEFWNPEIWSREMLVKAKTIPIEYFWIDNDKGRRCIKASKLAYSYDYYFHNGVFRRKIYQPKSKLKWVSNVDDTTVQLIDVMPKYGDILFITSSKKDAGVFWRININGWFKDKIIHGVAPNTETSICPSQWLDKMKSRWKRIILYYDSDNPGITNAKHFSELYGLEYMYNPTIVEKDPFDYSCKYGIKQFYEQLIEQINDTRRI